MSTGHFFCGNIGCKCRDREGLKRMIAKRKVAFYTLGCKVNQYETNSMMEEFIKAGYEVVDYESFADVYVVNTCTVTNMSDRKSRQILRRAKEINNESVLCEIGRASCRERV